MSRRPKARKPKSSRPAPVSGGPNVAQEFALANSALRLFTKRIVISGALASSGAGLIPASNLATTSSVTAAGDFSTLASVYSNYRVRAIRVSCKPFYKVNTTATVVSPQIAVIPFRSGLVPTTYAGFQESSEVKYASGYEPLTISTSNAGYPDGKLWYPTNTSIAAADSYGIAAMGQQTIAGTATTNVWWFTVEYLVEFTVEN